MIRMPRVHHWGSVLGLIGGMVLGTLLIRQVGLGPILAVMDRAKGGIALVILFHGVQIALTAIAWRTVSKCLSAVPPVRVYALLRWLREGINSLLPVAQIGGPLLAVRLLRRSGQNTAVAAAGAIVDTSVEMATQVAFTLFGLGLLADIKGSNAVAPEALAGLGAFSGLTAAVIAAQRLGGAKLADHAAARLGWKGEGGGLHDAITGIYRRRGALGSAAGFHLLAWALGGVEVAMAFHFFGRDIGLGPALVIESLGQAVRSVGFAVPAALGVQEGGYVLVCGALGLSPELALALSLVRRLRDIVYGVPSIGLWLWLERSGLLRHSPNP